MRSRSRALWPALSALAALPFVVLLVAVIGAGKEPLGVDRWWASLMADAQVPLLTTPMSWVSWLGGGLFGGVVVPALLAVLLWRLRSSRAAVVFVVVEVISLVAVQLVKHVVSRPRPPTATLADASSSFPSGHTANAATMTVLLALLLGRRWLRVLAVAWTVVMALSRTYLGEHWLTDTIAGASLGVAVALACWPLAGSWVTWPFRRVRPQRHQPSLAHDPAPGRPATPGDVR